MEKSTGECAPQEFRHSELLSNTSIRLLQIHAELLCGNISCTLQHYETDNQPCPDYTALSYVWGKSTPTHTIYINGMVYRVHQSLWKFLSHIQSKGEAERTWLWTDLICIDQAHHSEKNEQIARMGDIYAQAAHVISWLGNSDETAEALQVFRDTPEGIDTETEPRYRWWSSESEQIHRACDQIAFRESYWGRVWIFQEVACARVCIVACGDVSISFEDLVRKMEAAMRRTVRFHDSSQRDKRMERVKALADLKTSMQQKKNINILKILEKTSFCQATRDRDEIYGLIGLASRLDPGFDPNDLEVSQHKTRTDVWWDIIFMTLDKITGVSSIEKDIDALCVLVEELDPPRSQWPLDMGSSIRRAQFETAFQVSEAAYSWPVQRSLGIHYWQFEINRWDGDGGYDGSMLTSRGALRAEWDQVIQHIWHNDVPGLRTSLGQSAYAALRFTSWHGYVDESRCTPAKSLPLGWFCAAHMPDHLSKITAKHLVTSTFLEDQNFDPLNCPGAEHGEGRCEFSSLVLSIEQLGITCLVRSGRPSRAGVDVKFFCDCCCSGCGALHAVHFAPGRCGPE